MSTNYQRGADQERRTVKKLEEDGYYATRSAGSHGAADVLGWSLDERPDLLIQCTLGKRKSKAEKLALKKIADLRTEAGKQTQAIIVGKGQKWERL